MSDVGDSEIARLRQEVAGLRDALVEARSEAVRQADIAFEGGAQRAELLRRSAEAKATAARLAATTEKDSQALRHQNQTLEQETQKLKQESQQRDQENKQIKADAAALGESAKRLKAQLADAAREIEVLNGRIKTFKNSVSWRITLPIRKAAVVSRLLRPKRAG